MKSRSNHPECSVKKVFLKIAKLKETPVPQTLLKKRLLAQLFSCEFCEIFKNIYFYRTPLVAAGA